MGKVITHNGKIVRDAILKLLNDIEKDTEKNKNTDIRETADSITETLNQILVAEDGKYKGLDFSVLKLELEELGKQIHKRNTLNSEVLNSEIFEGNLVRDMVTELKKIDQIEKKLDDNYYRISQNRRLRIKYSKKHPVLKRRNSIELLMLLQPANAQNILLLKVEEKNVSIEQDALVAKELRDLFCELFEDENVCAVAFSQSNYLIFVQILQCYDSIDRVRGTVFVEEKNLRQEVYSYMKKLRLNVLGYYENIKLSNNEEEKE